MMPLFALRSKGAGGPHLELNSWDSSCLSTVPKRMPVFASLHHWPAGPGHQAPPLAHLQPGLCHGHLHCQGQEHVPCAMNGCS